MAQQSKWLDSNTKFDVNNPKARHIFTEQDFFKWSSNNFYRTSTNDMTSKTPVERKANVFPGYQGYVPHVNVNNDHLGKTKTEQSREVFKQHILDSTKNQFSSTGFNTGNQGRAVDCELHATSRRYGKSTMVATSGNIQPSDYKTTTFRASYHSPFVAHNRPNWRDRGTEQKFDNHHKLKVQERSDGLVSGYAACRQHWDGTTWATEKNTHTDQMRTLYRLKFDQPKPFHKVELRNNDGRLKVKQHIWDTIDK